MTNGVFSEYDLREMGIKLKSADAYQTANCVGSSEETMDTKVTTKKCRGVVVKRKVKGTGTGTLKISMHIPWNIFVQMFGMENAALIDGVKGYGNLSVHEEFSVVQHVYDEDDAEKFKAYPNCVMTSGIARKIENGAEEVAESELEIAVMPDEYGFGVYEALAEELKDETAKANWMTAFEPSLVRKDTASA